MSEKFFYAQDENVVELNPNDLNGIEINQSRFRNKPGMLMCYADWCGHCANRQTRDLWSSIAKESTPNLAIGSLNGSEHSTQIPINGYPTIFYVEDGVIDTEPFRGQRTKQDLFNFVCSKIKNGKYYKKFKHIVD